MTNKKNDELEKNQLLKMSNKLFSRVVKITNLLKKSSDKAQTEKLLEEAIWEWNKAAIKLNKIPRKC